MAGLYGPYFNVSTVTSGSRTLPGNSPGCQGRSSQPDARLSGAVLPHHVEAPAAWPAAPASVSVVVVAYASAPFVGFVAGDAVPSAASARRSPVSAQPSDGPAPVSVAVSGGLAPASDTSFVVAADISGRPSRFRCSEKVAAARALALHSDAHS